MTNKFLLIDSNILVYAINADSEKHVVAQDFVRQHTGNIVVAHQNILEALRVLTHARFERPLSPKLAQQAVQGIVDGCRVIAPDDTARILAMRFINDAQLTGNKIFDAYLAATALSAGISSIATDNIKDFTVLRTTINLINPFV